MASTVEKFLVGLALIVNTFVILVMYFVSNTILGPVFNFAGNFFANNQVYFAMTDISYIPSFIFGLLLVLEIVLVIGGAMVLGRRDYAGDSFD